MKRLTIFALALALALTGCAGATVTPDEAPESIQVIAMDTAMAFTAYGERSTGAVYAAEEMVRRLEGLLSRTDEDSQVSALNRSGGAPVTVDGDVAALLEAAAAYTEATGGAFDVTIAPVATAWGFTTDYYQVPAQAEIEELLTYVGMDHVHLEGDTVRLDPGTQIDLGGIAKGYVSDLTAEIFREYQVPRGLVRLGGSILAWGDKPDGSDWLVGIQDPARVGQADAYAGVLRLKDACAVTSGSYERYFEENGRRYHHIIDPATGRPAESGLVSVTVVAGTEDGTLCDALSTALFVMGEQGALDFWRSGVYDFDLVLVTEDGRVVSTPGAAERLIQTEDSGYAYETVS